MAKQQNQDFRNYDKEARDLIKSMPSNQMYELYEIVVNMQQSRQSEERLKELKAVQKAIEKTPKLSRERLRATLKGHGEMASGAKARDGNTKINRKKV